MPQSKKVDFFVSRRGSVAVVAQEVVTTLEEKGYRVFCQDYDIPIGSNFVDAMHEGIKNARDLIILFTQDYERSPYTRKEFTSFEAERSLSVDRRNIVVLRCEDVPLRGLLADCVFQDLFGVEDPAERKRRILDAAEQRTVEDRPPPRPLLGVPARLGGFVGRVQDLDRTDALLSRNDDELSTNSRVVVHGMPGVGKTSLAVEYANRYRNLYAGVCWCSAEHREALVASLASLSPALGLQLSEKHDAADVALAVLRTLTESRARWLLVYDNAGTPDQIVDLLPAGPSRLLITSQYADWGDWAQEVSLDVLPVEDATTLIQRRSGIDDATGAIALGKVLGWLPLALNQAAAYCKRTGMSFSSYAESASRLVAIAPRGLAYPRSVSATFDLALAKAAENCATAELLMTCVAQFGRDSIPMILLGGTIQEDEQDHEAISALFELSLLRHDRLENGTPIVTVHRLVQAAAWDRGVSQGLVRAAFGRLLLRLEVLCPLVATGLSAADAGSKPGVSRLKARLAQMTEANHDRRIFGALDDAERYYDARGEPYPPSLVENIAENLEQYRQLNRICSWIGFRWT